VAFDLDGFPDLRSAYFINAFGGRPTPRFTVLFRSRKARLIEGAKQLLAAVRTSRGQHPGGLPN